MGCSKKYIGSSAVLKRRYNEYSNPEYIARNLKKGNSQILNALIKYGYSKFSFEILEFCDIKNVLVREQYYIDLLKPEYNILLKAGSPLGYKHTDEAKEKMKGTKIFSLEHLTKIKEHIKNLNAKRAVIIEVLDTEKNISLSPHKVQEGDQEYASIRLTARELNSNDRTITRYINSNKLFLNRYIIKRKEKKD